MSQEEIIKGNKLIAEFMLAENNFSDIYYLPQFGYYFNSYGNIEYNDCFRANELKYHCSWGWLMPVVEKIETIETEKDGHFGVFISSNTCMIQGTKLYLALKDPKTYGFVYMSDPNAIFSTKLESTWYNVVEFIKWYNTQNQ